MSRRNILAVLFAVVLGISTSQPAGAGISPRVQIIQSLYSDLVSPNNVQSASEPSPVDALFSPTGVQGRIAPIGEGHDLSSVKEVFFLLSPPAGSAFVVTGVTFRSIEDLDPTVNVVVDVSFASTTGVPPYQVRETGHFSFADPHHIASFDLSIPYFDFMMTSVVRENLSDPNFVTAAIQEICDAAVDVPGGGFGFCSGSNAQYPDISTCVSYLSSIPVGTFDRVSSNTVACRASHLAWVQVNPTFECPNLGRAGGTECMDTPYSTYFSETF